MANQSINKEPRYNLRFVLHETGIKADTLRAWERRYNLPQPERTAGGHRLFSDYDIETVKWLLSREDEGMSISRAVGLWRDIESEGRDPLFSSTNGPLVQPLIATFGGENEILEESRRRWIQACLNYDEQTAEQLLTQSFAQFPLETVVVEILQAGLAEIGNLWYRGTASVQQEHFASELAIRRLHTLISAAPLPLRDRTVLIGCPTGENHTFSALMMTLLLRYRGWNVIYLGANVPKARFKETIEDTKPNLIVMIAMRLATAANLYDTALFLTDVNIPLAFGGRVFDVIPDLTHKIPGNYLGEDLLESITTIETLLSGSVPQISVDFKLNGLSDTLSQFVDKVHLIENQALKSIKAQGRKGVNLDYFQEANAYFSEDIIAGLTLGDLGLIESDLDWITGLISNFNITSDVLINYLSTYRDAAVVNLDQSGQPVIDWLTSIITDKS